MFKHGKTQNMPFYFFFILAILTLGTLFIPYSREYFFLFDDISQLNSVSGLSFVEIFQAPIAGTYRPLGYFFWKINLNLFGWQNAGGYSLVNLATHCMSALLLGFLLRVFQASSIMAWAAASIFLCFPAMSEALFWMTGGHDVYGMPFLLISLISAGLMLHRSNRKTQLVLGLGLFLGNLLSLLSKETGYVAFPIAFSL
jgi:hypothetical protein